METHERIKLYREHAGKTQQETANFLGIDQSTYNQYESGQRRPDAKCLHKILKFFHVPIFPVHRKVIYPPGLLNRLKDSLDQNGTPTNDSHENRRRFDEISKVLNEILDIRIDAMSIDDLPIDTRNLNFLSTPLTVLNIDLDKRGEDLIKRAIQCQEDLKYPDPIQE